MGLELVMRLKALLSEENAKHLSVILDILTSGDSRTYSNFWNEFQERLGVMPGEGGVAKKAWSALKELRGIVEEFRRE